MLENMAAPWKTFQRFAENLVFNEAPKFIRQQLQSDTVTRGIQQGIKFGIDAIVGTAAGDTRAITAGRPVTDNSVPTVQRARKIVYAPDLDGRADPGEIVWTWVVYEDDPTRGKDRPVLVVGRDRRTLLGLMLSSQEHHRNDPDWVGIGTGPWDYEAAPAGSGWTGYSMCLKRAFAGKARSWSATCSRSSRPGYAPNTPGANVAFATSATAVARRRAA